MNLQHLLSGVVPVEWMSQIETLPSFAIDDEFDTKEQELSRKLKQADTTEKRQECIFLRETLKDKKQQWNSLCK